MKALVFLFLLVLSGCKTIDESFTTNLKITSTEIEWIVVENADVFCSEKKNIRVTWFEVITACAVWRLDFSKCTIYTNKELTHSTLGHEIRHCFEGSFH